MLVALFFLKKNGMDGSSQTPQQQEKCFNSSEIAPSDCQILVSS